MNESGINSFDEFVLFYLFAGCIVGLLWAVFEADVVLGPISTYGRRHARRLRLTRWLAPLGQRSVDRQRCARSASSGGDRGGVVAGIECGHVVVGNGAAPAGPPGASGC